MERRFKFSFAIITILSLLILSACGGNNAKPSSNASSPANASQKPADAKPEPSKANDGNTLTLKLGHQSTLNSNYQFLALKFKELVEQKSGGKVKIEVYPMRQLGQDRELLEAMQFGNLDLGVITSAPVSNFAPQFSVLDLPYLFKDWDHIYRFIDSAAAKDLMKETEAKGLKTMAIMPRGFRHVTHANKPINNPADIKGMKIRVIESPVYVDMFKAMGANPQAMNWGDTYTAMQQGAIDGQENTMDIIFEERVNEVQKFVSKTGHVVAFGTLMASKARFDKWPADVQKIIDESAKEANKEISKQNKSFEDEYQKKLQDKGMKINDVDREPFREMVKKVYEPFAKKNGDKYLKAIEALRN